MEKTITLNPNKDWLLHCDEPWTRHRTLIDLLGASDSSPQPIPREELSVERLAAALTEATQNTEMQAAARRIGERISTENGIETTVQLIEEATGK